MRRLVSIVALLIAGPRVAKADDSCVSGSMAQLAPSTVLAKERIVEQDKSCSVIIAKRDAYTNKCKADPTVDAALAFCQDPVDLKTAAVSEDDLQTSRKKVEATECTVKAAGVTVQSGFPVLSMGSELQDELIRGIAKFVISRAKAEAQAFLVTKLASKVCASADARGLLPATCRQLQAADPSGGVPMSWGTLKSAFEIDLERLPERAVECVARKAKADEHTIGFLVTGVQIAELVRENEDPIAVLAGLTYRYPTTPKLCSEDKLGCGMNMLGFTIRRLAPEGDVDDLVQVDNAVRFTKIAARR